VSRPIFETCISQIQGRNTNDSFRSSFVNFGRRPQCLC